MQLLVALLLVSLLAGQVGAIPVAPGVTVYLHDFIVVTIVGYCFLTGTAKRSLSRNSLFLPFFAFTAVGILSLLVNQSSVSTEEFWKGSLYLFRWVTYAGVYFVLEGSSVSSLFILRGLFFLGTGLAVTGLIQFFLYPDLRNLMYLGWDPHYYRVFSTLFDPNFAGILFVLTLIVGATFLQQKREIGVIGGMGVSLTALLLTYSRSSYLSFLAAAGVWVVLHRKWKVGFVSLLIFLIVVVYLPRTGREALSLDRFDSTVSRLNNWSESIQRIGQKPILGYGFNVLPFLQQDSSIPSKAGAGIDNSFLFVGVTTGLVGLIAYGWLLWSMMRMRKHWLYLASFVAVIVHSFFVNSLFYPWVMLWLWILIAGI